MFGLILVAYVLFAPVWIVGKKQKVDWKWIEFLLPILAFALWGAIDMILGPLIHRQKSLSNFAIEMGMVQLSAVILMWLRLVPRFRGEKFAWVNVAIVGAIVIGVGLIIPTLPE